MSIDDEFRLFQEDLRKTFLSEAQEHLDEIEGELSLWQESQGEDIIRDIFRRVHSIKGSSGVCNLNKFSNNLHRFEDLLKLVVEGKVSPSDKLMECFYNCIDKLSDAIKEIKNHEESHSDDDIPLLVVSFMEKLQFSADDNHGQVTPAGISETTIAQQSEAVEDTSDQQNLLFRGTVETPIVLFCDDDGNFSAMIERVLNKEGFEVIRAKNGREGLEILSSQRIDLILADFLMPELNGIEMLEATRSRNINTPFILISGHAKIDDLAKYMLKFDACYFLDKPVSVNVLRLAVRQAARLYFTQTILEEMSIHNFRAYVGCKKLAYQNISEDKRNNLEQDIEMSMGKVVKLVDKLRKSINFTPGYRERRKSC